MAVKVNAVPGANARGGRSAGEHVIAELRCLYRYAEDDGLIDATDNPASKMAKPRRLPSTRRAVADTRLAEINETASTTGNDPALSRRVPGTQPSAVTTLWSATRPRQSTATSPYTVLFVRGAGRVGSGSIRRAATVLDGVPAGCPS